MLEALQIAILLIACSAHGSSYSAPRATFLSPKPQSFPVSEFYHSPTLNKTLFFSEIYYVQKGKKEGFQVSFPNFDPQYSNNIISLDAVNDFFDGSFIATSLWEADKEAEQWQVGVWKSTDLEQWSRMPEIGEALPSVNFLSDFATDGKTSIFAYESIFFIMVNNDSLTTSNFVKVTTLQSDCVYHILYHAAGGYFVAYFSQCDTVPQAYLWTSKDGISWKPQPAFTFGPIGFVRSVADGSLVYVKGNDIQGSHDLFRTKDLQSLQHLFFYNGESMHYPNIFHEVLCEASGRCLAVFLEGYNFQAFTYTRAIVFMSDLAFTKFAKTKVFDNSDNALGTPRLGLSSEAAFIYGYNPWQYEWMQYRFASPTATWMETKSSGVQPSFSQGIFYNEFTDRFYAPVEGGLMVGQLSTGWAWEEIPGGTAFCGALQPQALKVEALMSLQDTRGRFVFLCGDMPYIVVTSDAKFSSFNASELFPGFDRAETLLVIPHQPVASNVSLVAVGPGILSGSEYGPLACHCTYEATAEGLPCLHKNDWRCVRIVRATSPPMTNALQWDSVGEVLYYLNENGLFESGDLGATWRQQLEATQQKVLSSLVLGPISNGANKKNLLVVSTTFDNEQSVVVYENTDTMKVLCEATSTRTQDVLLFHEAADAYVSMCPQRVVGMSSDGCEWTYSSSGTNVNPTGGAAVMKDEKTIICVGDNGLTMSFQF